MDNETLVKSIRTLCQINNVSISQLENDLNFGAGLISRWTKSSPSIDKIVDIANYFHVSLDEVVGYKQDLNDNFLNKLYEKTSDKSISWKLQDVSVNPQDEDDPEEALLGILIGERKHVICTASYKEGYIILNTCYYTTNILIPSEIMLFIQPSVDSKRVKMHYDKDELSRLWVAILNNINENIPDEVKAEKFKNDFLWEM